MFGYLKLDKDELKYKYIKKYQSIYCALCNSLHKKYGILYASFLNYESVFLYFYLQFVYQTYDETEIVARCLLNPLIKKHFIYDEKIMDYVTFINLLLVEFKCRDDIYDDRSFFKRVLNYVINKNVKFMKDKEEHKDLVVELEDIMEQFNEREKKHCSIDECMSSMGSFLQIIVYYFIQINGVEGNNIEEICSIANIIGKWIYIIDAFDDLEKDKKKNNFNPLMMIKKDGEEMNTQQKIARVILEMITIDIDRKISELNTKNYDIIENILKFGIKNTLTQIIINKSRKYKKNNIVL